MARVLIIEDDLSALTLNLDLLKAEKIDVETAMGGADGREMIEKRPPDVLILDLGLPDEYGLDICRDVKKKHPETRVFILTVLGNSQDVVAGFEAGADDYLAKPYNHREFIFRLKRLLEKTGKQ